MKITKILEEIAEEICDGYCKYPQIVHEKWLKEEIEEDRDEYLEEHYCDQCPLKVKL